MHLLLMTFSLAYIVGFFKILNNFQIPDGLFHVLLPFAAWGLYYAPDLWLTIIASCGMVYVLEGIFSSAKQPSQRVVKRKSNIPPPP